MSDPFPPNAESASAVAPVVRSSMISTHRLAIVCPTPAFDADGCSESSYLDRQRARFGFLFRLWRTRLVFRHQRLGRVGPRLTQLRMSLRLMLLKRRVKRRLKNS